LLVVFILWITQPPHLRSKDVAAVLVIIACTKFMYYCDVQRSMNFDTEEIFLKHRSILRSNPELTQAVPLLLCFFLENKIIRHYKFGNF